MFIIKSINSTSSSKLSIDKSELLESTAEISKNGTISMNILEFRYMPTKLIPLYLNIVCELFFFFFTNSH